MARAIDVDRIQRQAVIDLLYYYADEACSAIVADVERIPGICAYVKGEI